MGSYRTGFADGTFQCFFGTQGRFFAEVFQVHVFNDEVRTAHVGAVADQQIAERFSDGFRTHGFGQLIAGYPFTGVFQLFFDQSVAVFLQGHADSARDGLFDHHQFRRTVLGGFDLVHQRVRVGDGDTVRNGIEHDGIGEDAVDVTGSQFNDGALDAHQGIVGRGQGCFQSADAATNGRQYVEDFHNGGSNDSQRTVRVGLDDQIAFGNIGGNNRSTSGTFYPGVFGNVQGLFSSDDLYYLLQGHVEAPLNTEYIGCKIRFA